MLTQRQRRHDAAYNDLMTRIHDGAIGEIVGGQVYWNHGGLWMNERQPEWSDVEWQLRNWLYFTWLSGDHICEQHVHNIDIMHWGIGADPEMVMAIGGRQERTGPEFGNVFDHFAAELTFPNGVRVSSMCRQQAASGFHVAERLVGTLEQCA